MNNNTKDIQEIIRICTTESSCEGCPCLNEQGRCTCDYEPIKIHKRILTDAICAIEDAMIELIGRILKDEQS